MVSPSILTVMPGSFTFDTTLPPKLDINVGAKSHFFQPPKTPSASSSLYRSTASLSTQDVSSSISSRKRSRHDSFQDQTTPFSARSHAWSMASDTPSTFETSDAMSPMPFVTTKYELAGGLDTPTAATSSAMDVGEEAYRASPDLHLRGGRGFRGIELASDSYFPHPASALSKDRDGLPRLPASPRIRDGLGRAVYSVVGVAGKMLEFCKTAAFKGFFAGGGPGYEMKAPLHSVDGDQSIWLDTERDDAFDAYKREKGSTPGCFPKEDYIPDYMSQNHTTPPRAAKKIQREKGTGEISTSWVMIEDSNPTSRETSPSRLSHRKVPPMNTALRRPIAKIGRRPILPVPRPSLTSYAGSPGLRSDRPASFASPRSPLSTPKHESRVSVEVQRHAARMRKRDLEEDANLKRLNQQLKAMIKEGKEALGTKFEVEEEPIDEGYAEGEYFYDKRKG